MVKNCGFPIGKEEDGNPLLFLHPLEHISGYFFNSLIINSMTTRVKNCNSILVKNWNISKWVLILDSIVHIHIPPRLFYRIFIWFTSFSTFCTQIEKQEVTSFFEFIDIYQFIAYNKDVKSGQIILFRILGFIKNYLVLRKLR